MNFFGRKLNFVITFSVVVVLVGFAVIQHANSAELTAETLKFEGNIDKIKDSYSFRTLQARDTSSTEAAQSETTSENTALDDAVNTAKSIITKIKEFWNSLSPLAKAGLVIGIIVAVLLLILVLLRCITCCCGCGR